MTSVLIVDDEPGALETLSDILTAKGYEVKTAKNGTSALVLTAKGPFDLAILDIKMPDVDGTELLKTLKTLYPELEAIMVTGFATMENAVAAMENGALAYLLKPLKMDEVLIYLERALNKQKARMELAQKKRELERFNKLAEGRELREGEVKKGINALLAKLGRPPKY
jgi:DNA-binding NtrC family response regulator